MSQAANPAVETDEDVGHSSSQGQIAEIDGGTASANDPVVRSLTLAIVGVIVLFLVGIISAIVLGFMRPAEAPRTLAERDLGTYGSLVKAGKADPKTTASYAGALIDVGQRSEAARVLSKAIKSAETDKSYLLVQQARLEFIKKDWAACASTAEEAQSEAEKELEERLEALAKKSIMQDPNMERPTSWLPALHLQGDALAEMGKTAKAIEAFDEYLEVSPTDADMLTVRGELKLKVGDKAGAEKDFREALRFMPDYRPALDGLKAAGADAG